MEAFDVIDKASLEINNVCANCNKQLNVTPIYSLASNHDINEICGRCVNIADGYSQNKKWRLYALENISKFLTFPCCNKKFGCQSVLYWNDVVAHEKTCAFQGTKCPLAETQIVPDGNCTWEGNVEEFNEHVEESHKSYILNPPQIDWTDCKENNIYFAHVGKQIITIVIKYEDESTYYCLLMVNGSDIESQCYRFQLELFDESKNNSIIIRKSRLEPLGLMKEAFNNSNKMLEIDLIKIKQLLKHTKSISGRFGIVRKPKKEIALITGGKDLDLVTPPAAKLKETKVLDETMLQELECPICNEFMIPPIYICRTGHSICNSCKGKVLTCPSCRDRLSGARNFTLERLTTKVNYPCRNRDIGCSYMTTSDKILAHQLICDLSENPCLLQCGWQGLQPDLFNHLKISHSSYVLDTNVIYKGDFERNNEMYYFLQAYGELFRFNIKRDASLNRQKFNIQQVSLVDDIPKFHFQLQIVDHLNMCVNMTFTNVCLPLTELKDAHTKGAIPICSDLLEPFLFNRRYYHYKVLISKT